MNISLLDLAPFCQTENEPSRFELKTPWLFGDGLVAATNGHIAIVVPASIISDMTDLSSENRPKLEVIVELAATNTRVEALPLESLLNKEIDEYQTRLSEWHESMVECDCNNGYCRCSCGDQHECGVCDGEGVTAKGPRPQGPKNLEITIKGKVFQYKYIQRVRKFAEYLGLDSVIYCDDETKPHGVSTILAGEATFYVMCLKK